MKIESITIKGFRCFNEDGETILFDDLTCFVGPNASGKTAAMMALARVFSENRTQRQIIPADFHLSPGEDIKNRSPRTLSIECRLAFPELEEGVVRSAAVPETFNQMIVDNPDGTPYCRIRLEATWINDNTPAGDVEQSVSWILTNSDDLKEINEDGNRHRVQPGDRGKVRVIYIPAARDPDQQIRATTSNSFGRLMAMLSWNGADESLKDKLMELQSELAELSGIKTMNTQIQAAWQELYDGRIAREVSLKALEEDPANLIKLLIPTFQPSGDGRAILVSDLSDGFRSLFSLSLSLGLFRVEEILLNTAAAAGFKAEVANEIPSLTVFLVEEPENHLSPHYLGRVVAKLEEITLEGRAQVILSSHSPSILGRVAPDQVRYFLGNEQTAATRVKPIALPPDKTDEAFKYVREAVRGCPELYFSRLIILGEGPSEEIVLRRLFEASGAPLDTHFISIVPLGGRHVNHFWRLLHGLDIPFLTLLDLDREKEGAGWGRIQYVRDQLVLRFGPKHETLHFKTDGKKIRRLDEDTYDTLYKNPDSNTVDMDAWISFFEDRFGVYFLSPLDLDFAMLEVFPDAYKGLAPSPGGPRLPKQGTPTYQDAVIQRVKQVLAADVSNAPADLGSTYTPSQQELFAWYKYLFVDGSKPVSHMRALLSIDSDSLVANAPDVLKRLVEKARMLVTPPNGDI
jgi:predicted ATP-dependent endonuclease of OLD family